MDKTYLILKELEYLQSRYGFPGITFAYVLQDGTVGEIAYGLADLETKGPMGSQSRMLAASVGKTFVAALLIALAKEGHLELDDLLSRWLGECSWYPRLANHEAMTLRHLLTHSSGLSDHVYSASFQQLLALTEAPTPESLIECILDQAPRFGAGEGWAYTDTGYILLGLVIEKVTGNSYYDELTERFLKPLQLEMTSPSNQPMLPGIIAGYAAPNPFGLPEKTVDASGSLLWNPAFEWTGGGLISTSRDLALWAKLFFEGRAFQTDYLSDLFQSVSVCEASKVRYGAGVVIDQTDSQGQRWGHYGIIPGYSSSMRYYPNYGIAIAFQMNTDRGVTDFINDIEERLAEIIIR